MAAPAPPSAADVAAEVFGDSYPMLVDLLKSTAPVLIGAALTLLAIQWVVRAVAAGRAPSLDDPTLDSYRDTYARNGKRRVTEWWDTEDQVFVGQTHDGGRFYTRRAGESRRKYDR